MSSTAVCSAALALITGVMGAQVGQLLMHMRVSGNNRMLPFTMQLIEQISNASLPASAGVRQELCVYAHGPQERWPLMSSCCGFFHSKL